jgi:hypothetical protein
METYMKNDQNLSDLDVDYRALTPAQWEVFKRQIIERARRQRAEVLRILIRALFSKLRHAFVAVWNALHASKHQPFHSHGV